MSGRTDADPDGLLHKQLHAAKCTETEARTRALVCATSDHTDTIHVATDHTMQHNWHVH
jgi:hypothetical protein